MATLATGLRARFGRTGLAPAGLHQEVSPSHLRFLLLHAFPSAITMSAPLDASSLYLIGSGEEVAGVRFVRGTARYRTWRAVERRPLDRASRSPVRGSSS